VTDDMLRLAIVGSPEDAIAAIEGLADAGVTQVCLGGPLGPDPAEAVRLVGERVIPAFR
jgi:5,10-methylenetetrahydromethanopterin reductase